jgi:glutamate formiminotransferase/formiminotetrahydrofolate cyclodeaminase
MKKIVECVPNFSEGRDRAVIEAITGEISGTAGATLLDVDPGADTNRTVVTFVGTPDGVVEAAFRAIKRASEVIDMTRHSGAHARQGATDVCPLVPVAGITVEECVKLANTLAKRVGEELEIPVYLYEHAATREERRNLADIRAGEYEALEEKLGDPFWKPDFGPARFNARAGATVIGVREFLIAYNINFNTRNRKLVHDIALDIREKGRWKRDDGGKIVRDEKGKKVRKAGVFQCVKGVGWYIEEYGQAQLSMNLTNYHVTPPHAVFDEVCLQAEKRGIRVTGSELVGLVPLEAMREAGKHYLKKQGLSWGVPEKELIHIAVKSMGMCDITPFKAEEKIIEYRIEREGVDLTGMGIVDFVDELSTDSPAPGGGSVAALAGSLGAALSSMVSNLTVGKKGYEAVNDKMIEVAEKAQNLKDELLATVNEDTDAFNRVMDAFRLPKKTDEAKAVREDAIQNATKEATLLPLKVLRLSLNVLDLAEEAVLHGNRNSISDAGVAALMGNTCADGAFYNVMINLGSITDGDFVKNTRGDAEKYRDKAHEKASYIDKAVMKVLCDELEKQR